ncbi:MAG: hypothetical protein ACI4A7_00960 [Prevotella sp.]
MKKIYTMKNLAIVLALAMAMPATVQAQNESDVLFYESFDGLTGQGGNDGYFDNDVDAGVEVGAEDLLTSDLLDNKEGWGDFVKVAICNKCVRIATKKNRGEITTPSFAVNGTANLTFNAAAQLGDIVILYVEIVGEGKLTYNGQTAQKIEIALPESVAGETTLANQLNTVAISEAVGNISLKFSTESSSDNKQRAYIDEIKVVADKSSGITTLKEANKEPDVYDILGRKVNKMGKGIYIINGKKIVSKIAH